MKSNEKIASRSWRRPLLPTTTLAVVVVKIMVILSVLAVSNAFVLPSSTGTTSRIAPIQQQQQARLPPQHKSLFPPSTATSTSTTTRTQLFYIPGIEVSDVVYDSVSTAFDAWEWTNAIGAPAALVAGAVLVTLSETRETTAPRKADSRRTRFLKLSMRFLLLTSFALEVVSIFTATITGTVLLGQSEATVARKMIGYDAPLQLMKHHHEYVL